MKRIWLTLFLVSTFWLLGVQVNAQVEYTRLDLPEQQVCQKLEQRLLDNNSEFTLTKRRISGGITWQSEIALDFENRCSVVSVEVTSYFSRGEAIDSMNFTNSVVSNAGLSFGLNAFGEYATVGGGLQASWIRFVHNTLLIEVTVRPKPGFKEEPVKETASHQSVSKENTDGGAVRATEPFIALNQPGVKLPLQSTHPVAREFATYLWEAAINLQK